MSPISRPTGNQSGSTPDRAPSQLKRQTHQWARRVHVYASMITLIIVLFFGLTGIALNHPEWTFGEEVSVTSVEGVFPFAVTNTDGSVQFLTISEFVRAEHDVSGEVDSFDVSGSEGTIAYRNAGFAADLFFDVESGSYELTTAEEGWVAVFRDLHRGESTGGLWSWVIDLTAGFLITLSLTGLTMQLFLRKRRRSAILTAAAGTALAVVLVAITLA